MYPPYKLPTTKTTASAFKKNRLVAYPFAHNSVGHTDGTSTVTKNAPERGMDTLMRKLKII